MSESFKKWYSNPENRKRKQEQNKAWAEAHPERIREINREAMRRYRLRKKLAQEKALQEEN